MPRLSKIGAAALAAFGWTSGSAVSASYLVVAGGGSGGGGYFAGGGGAGGLLTGTASLNPTLTYTITIGAGAATVSGNSTNGLQGSNTTFSAIATTAVGGGYGAGYGASGVVGGVGGSGGGTAANALATVAAGTSGQGNAGGQSSNNGGGGGGGAGSVGGNAGASFGTGGTGSASSISGASVTYAAGAAGGITGVGNGASGTANTGNGGAASSASGGTSGAGGSGIVIISYVGAQQFSGGVVTSSGGNTIHTFTTSGTLGPVTPLSASYLIVAGGGASGSLSSFSSGLVGGGGGAGGLLSGSSLVIDTNSIYTVTVGAGGTGTAADGGNGTNSSFSVVTTTAVGGGGGSYPGNPGLAGGSGGGAGGHTLLPAASGGTGTSGQGNTGGSSVSNNRYGGSGGGAGGAGVTANGSGTGLALGGAGTASSITGSSVTYATGGSSGYNNTAGGNNTGNGGNTLNTGASQNGSNGGSGVVIISYSGSTQLMAGGVVTIAGGNVIHTFNSSGYLTPLTLLTRSLRFRSSATAYLSRTYGSSGSTTTATFSAWIKRGQLTSGGSFPIQGYSNGGNQTQQIAYQSDSLNFYVYNSAAICNVSTSAVYRDPAAWYHVVFQLDSTQATSTDRVRIYINGVQQATTGTQPAQNANLVLSIATQYNIGVIRTNGADGIFDGYMAEVNFIDGQALAPTAFGTVNSYGVWQPITYGGSYGTNGFRLPFTNNASTTTLGYDFSPQGNNWTTNNISVTAGSTYDSMTDVPTLTSATAANYATLNPLVNSSYQNITQGNLATFSNTSADSGIAVSTIGSSTGKFYWEVTVSGGSSGYPITGALRNIPASGNGTIPASNTLGGFSYYTNLGYVLREGSNITTVATSTTNDIIRFALDIDNLQVAIYKNNTLLYTLTGLTAGTYFPATATYASTGVYQNFGQQPFVYTPPSGFIALNTFNL